MLNMVHNVRAAQKRRDHGKSVQLWNWSRTKGWNVVRGVMRAAKISGPPRHAQGSAARLRHKSCHLRGALEHAPAAVRARPAIDDVHLRRCDGTRETPARRTDVEVTNLRR